MVDYKISHTGGCYYTPRTDTVAIGIRNIYKNDDDIIKVISDSITHEVLHKVFNDQFNSTLSCLFDIISDSLREHIELFKLGLDDSVRSWKQAVKEDGMEYFLNHYSCFIDNDILAEYNIRR